MRTRRAVTLLIGAGIALAGLATCVREAPSEPVVLRVAGTTSSAPLLNDLLPAYSRVNPNAEFELLQGNVDTAETYLREERADWALVTHLSSDSELWSAPVGTDALAIIVHPSNSVSGLTRSALRSIYEGQVRSWTQFGGPEQPIVAIVRDTGSGPRAAFDELVMGGQPTTPAARLSTTDESLLTIVRADPNAIGYISQALLDSSVRALPIDGVAASPETLQTGAYPLTTTLRFVARQEPDGPAAEFLRWVLSEDGQAVVAFHYAPFTR